VKVGRQTVFFGGIGAACAAKAVAAKPCR